MRPLGGVPARYPAELAAGIRFTLAGILVSGFAQFVALMILARLLVPEDFGVYAIATLVSASTTGFALQCIERAEFLAARPESRAAENLLLPFALAGLSLGVLAASARIAPDFPQTALAVALLYAPLSAVLLRTRVHMRRTHRFRQLATIETVSLIVGPVLSSVALARLGIGAHAMLLGQAVGALTVLALCFSLERASIRFTVDAADLAQSLRRAVAIARMIGLEVIHVQLPAGVLAVTLGTGPLGLFNRAIALTQLPQQLLASSMSRVLLSAIRDAASDRRRLISLTAQQISLAAAILFPIAGAMAGSASELTRLVLGDGFVVAAPLLPFLALSACAAMLGSLFGTIAEGLGLIQQKIRVQAASSLVLLLLVGAGALYSMEAAAAALAVAALFFLWAYGRLITKYLDLPIRVLLRWLAPGFAAGTLACALTSTIGATTADHPLIIVCAQLAACGMGVALFYRAAAPEMAADIIALLRRR